MAVISLAYLGIATGLMVARHVVLTPDYLFFLLMPLAFLSGRFVSWLTHWTPFVGLLLAWEAMRGVADKAGAAVSSGNLRPELWLFRGHLPTLVLQGWLDHGTLGRVVNEVTTLVYLLHFPAILAVAMVLWLADGRAFGAYVAAILLLCLGAFAVFLVMPTAPPWWAAEHGLIQGLDHVFLRTLPNSVSPYYASLDPNPVAADPSLHAAMPFVGFLAARRVSRTASLAVLAWAVLVWFTIVYLGEHYVLDAVTGVVWASLAWAAVGLSSRIQRGFRNRTPLAPGLRWQAAANPAQAGRKAA